MQRLCGRSDYGRGSVLDDEAQRVELSTLLVLDAVSDGALGVGQIAERLDVAPSTASCLVDRAVRAAMVRRAASVSDVRAVLVASTPAGRAPWARALAFRLDRLGAVTADGDQVEVAALALGLDQFARCVADQARKAGST